MLRVGGVTKQGGAGQGRPSRVMLRVGGVTKQAGAGQGRPSRGLQTPAHAGAHHDNRTSSVPYQLFVASEKKIRASFQPVFSDRVKGGGFLMAIIIQHVIMNCFKIYL